jgi:hypothetical protein
MNPHITPKTCVTCGACFSGGPTAKYCTECRTERIRQRDREKHQRKLAGTLRKIGSTAYCDICGQSYEVKGGNQKHCASCAAADSKRRRHESWLKEYYGDPDKRKQYLQRSRQWAVRNKSRTAEILRASYERHLANIKDKRRKRYGVKLKPLGRADTCPKCGNQFVVRERNQKYCSHCSPTMAPANDSCCEICGQPLPANRPKYCSPECWHEAVRKASIASADRYKALGICIKCSGPITTDGSALCETCKERQRVANAAIKKEGRCIACGKPTEIKPDGKHATRCQACNAKIRHKQNAEYERLKQSGVCTWCKARPAMTNKKGKQLTLCEVCNQRNNARMLGKITK